MDRGNQMIIPARRRRLFTRTKLRKILQPGVQDALVVSVRHENVANSPDRLDVAGHGRVGFDELAQA